MEIPKDVLKRLAEDFRDWSFTRNPCDTEFWTEIDYGYGCWDFTIDADPFVRMEDGAPEPDYPVVADVNVYSVEAEHYDWDNDITTPLDGNAVAENPIGIRKLTERECFRLMDVSDNDIDKIQAAGISRTQQYKMAGNSIVVSVLYHIFRKMFVEIQCETRQLKLF